MKNLIKLIKSDNYLLPISFGMVLSLIGTIVMLCRMFPKAMMVIAIVFGIAVIFGAIVVASYMWWMSCIEYKVDQQINDDRIFYHEK